MLAGGFCDTVARAANGLAAPWAATLEDGAGCETGTHVLTYFACAAGASTVGVGASLAPPSLVALSLRLGPIPSSLFGTILGTHCL